MAKSTTFDIESGGMKTLIAHLDAQGRSHQPSDIKSYDLIVDGKYCELKSTTQAFFGLTENQYSGLRAGKLASVFVVNGSSVTEYTADKLLAVNPKPETTYYYYHTQFQD
jgi:hypothetical protein